VTGSSAIIALAAAASGASGADPRAIERDWEAVRRSAEIQFAPLPPIKPPETPDWLESLQRALEVVFGPLAKGLISAWPVIEKVLIAGAVVLALYLAWRLLGPLLGLRRRTRVEEAWTPSREDALALLEDADRLAAEGRYGEAAHLLLQRSVGQIRAARPGTLQPASTAREIAALPQLPHAARGAFAIVAERVERSLFALRDLNAADWSAARAAYADFALAELRG
jgi:hypothetical protein